MPAVGSCLDCIAGVFSLLEWFVRIATTAFGAGLIDIQSPLAEKLSVQSPNGVFGLAVIRHFDKCKTPWAAGITIFDQRDGVNRSMRLEQVTDLILGRAEIQVADVDVFHRRLSSMARCSSGDGFTLPVVSFC
jgi:hypothetical protein